MPWFEGSCKSLSQGKPLEFAKLEVPGLPCQATNLRLMTGEKFSEDLAWTYLREDFLGRVEEPTPNHTFYNAHSCFGSLFTSQMSENLLFWCLHSPLDHDFWLEALLSRPTQPANYPEGENSSSIYVRSFLSCIFALIHVHLHVRFSSSLNHSVLQYSTPPSKRFGEVEKVFTYKPMQCDCKLEGKCFLAPGTQKRQQSKEQRNGTIENQNAEKQNGSRT